MTLNLPLLYFVWTEEYCQTSPNKKQIAKPLTRNKHLSLVYFLDGSYSILPRPLPAIFFLSASSNNNWTLECSAVCSAMEKKEKKKGKEMCSLFFFWFFLAFFVRLLSPLQCCSQMLHQDSEAGEWLISHRAQWPICFRFFSLNFNPGVIYRKSGLTKGQ